MAWSKYFPADSVFNLIDDTSWKDTRLDGMTGASIYDSTLSSQLTGSININASGKYFYTEDWIATPERGRCVKYRLAILPEKDYLFVSMEQHELNITDRPSFEAFQIFIPTGKYLITELDLVKNKLDYKIGDTPNG